MTSSIKVYLLTLCAAFLVSCEDDDSSADNETTELSFSTRPFITIWDTEHSAPNLSNVIKINTVPGVNYNYSVDWGDDRTDSNLSRSTAHAV